MIIRLVLSNFILVVWRSSDYGGRSNFILVVWILFCLTLYWWSGGLVITAVDLVLSNFILVVWRSSDYGGRSCFV